MARRQRTCLLCGEKYSYCPTCTPDKYKPTWMNEFHSENCKKIFDICTRYNMQLLSKEEAQAALEKCDLSKKETFKDYVQCDLANIFAKDEEKQPEHGAKAEAGILDEITEPKVCEVVNEKKNNK